MWKQWKKAGALRRILQRVGVEVEDVPEKEARSFRFVVVDDKSLNLALIIPMQQVDKASPLAAGVSEVRGWCQ